MKSTDFSKYLSDYLCKYLPVECGISRSTGRTGFAKNKERKLKNRRL
jgi:hypothetical protein